MIVSENSEIQGKVRDTHIHVMKDGCAKGDKVTMGRIENIENAPSVGTGEFATRKMYGLGVVRVGGRSVLVDEFVSVLEASSDTVAVSVHVWGYEGIWKTENGW